MTPSRTARWVVIAVTLASLSSRGSGLRYGAEIQSCSRSARGVSSFGLNRLYNLRFNRQALRRPSTFDRRAALGNGDPGISAEVENGEGLEDFESDELFDSTVAPGVNIEYPWGEPAFECAEKLLKMSSEFDDLNIYSFTTRNRARLEVALDKLSHPRGSPTLDEVSLFARRLRVALEEAIGDKANSLEIEVSTPGAEREIRIPADLERFSDFPMLVRYHNSTREEQHVMMFHRLDEATKTTHWKLADVRANRWLDKRGKSMPIRRRDREREFLISLNDLIRVNMHIDV
ncbi:hypothetical protein AAMO2058_000221400 [Amorphochlora amoebiformis]